MNSDLIAIITASAGFVVSISSLLINFLLNKKLESYKAKEALNSQLNAEYLKSYLLSLSDGKDREIEAFRILLRCVQIFRDKLNTVILSPRSYGVETLKKELSEIIITFNSSYADQQIFLPEEDRQLIHTLKKRCERLIPSILEFVKTNRNSDYSREGSRRGQQDKAGSRDTVWQGREIMPRGSTEVTLSPRERERPPGFPGSERSK